jgi:large subunit ribosomal protein L31
MKKDIHPKYVETKVSCSCGETFTTRSTAPEIKVEICSKCHPFYTGKQKFVDSGGRVQRFQKKFGSVLESNQEKTEEKVEDKKEESKEKVAEEAGQENI